MRLALLVLAGAVLVAAREPAIGAERSTVAGPVGNTDIRSALLPPSGLYVSDTSLAGEAIAFHDGYGKTPQGFENPYLTRLVSGVSLAYVPEAQVLGGRVALVGMVPIDQDCGRLFANTSIECLAGVADPYVEMDWSRSFGKVRASKFAGAVPIMEGFTLLLGVGAVLPVGRYDAALEKSNGVSVGNNIFDLAPTIAVTYTTAPILADGTEFSAKFYWNNYATNPATHYRGGDIANLDFAISERIGRYQVGIAGFYAAQVEDDQQFGVPVLPDGRRVETLSLGGVINYDLPEQNTSLKLKTLSTLMARNNIVADSVILAWTKKF